jgi:hypothetical protein
MRTIEEQVCTASELSKKSLQRAYNDGLHWLAHGVAEEIDEWLEEEKVPELVKLGFLDNVEIHWSLFTQGSGVSFTCDMIDLDEFSLATEQEKEDQCLSIERTRNGCTHEHSCTLAIDDDVSAEVCKQVWDTYLVQCRALKELIEERYLAGTSVGAFIEQSEANDQEFYLDGREYNGDY